MRLPFSCLAIASAEVTLPALLSDHAVLQRSPQTRIWGKAEPGEKVTVALGEIKAKAVADDKGRWQTMLDLSPSLPLSSPVPFGWMIAASISRPTVGKEIRDLLKIVEMNK